MKHLVTRAVIFSLLAAGLAAPASHSEILGPTYRITAKVLNVEGSKEITANRPGGAGPYDTRVYKLRIGLLEVKQLDEQGQPMTPRDFAYRRGVDFEVIAVPTYDLRATAIQEDIFIQGYLQKASGSSGETHRLQITDSSGRL